MLIVVRHGRTGANAAGELLGRRDPGLDAVGRAQAEAIAGAIGPVDRVVASPLTRTKETAEVIAAASFRHGSDDVAACSADLIEFDDRLIELDYGGLEGVPVRDVPASTWDAWRADTSWRPEGGESLEDLAVRVWSAFDDLAASPATSGARVAVVTHVSPIKAAVAWALGVGIEAQWRCFVAQGSITRIAMARGRPSLTSFNEVHHLPGRTAGVRA